MYHHQVHHHLRHGSSDRSTLPFLEGALNSSTLIDVSFFQEALLVRGFKRIILPRLCHDWKSHVQLPTIKLRLCKTHRILAALSKIYIFCFCFVLEEEDFSIIFETCVQLDQYHDITVDRLSVSQWNPFSSFSFQKLQVLSSVYVLAFVESSNFAFPSYLSNVWLMMVLDGFYCIMVRCTQKCCY